MQEFTQSGGVRPFGVSLLVIGSDDKGPMLYQVPPPNFYSLFSLLLSSLELSDTKSMSLKYEPSSELLALPQSG